MMSMMRLYFAIDIEKQFVSELVVFGATREPDLETLPDDEPDKESSDAGEGVAVDDVVNGVWQWFSNFLMWMAIGLAISVGFAISAKRV